MTSAISPLRTISQPRPFVSTAFDEVRTTEAVENEVLTEGKRGIATLAEFLTEMAVHDTPARADEVATMEEIAVTDGSVVLLAADWEILLANDKALAEVARTHDVDCWWVRTLLLSCANDGELSAAAASDVLYDLVDVGMNLQPRVYSQVQQKLRDVGE